MHEHVQPKKLPFTQPANQKTEIEGLVEESTWKRDSETQTG